MLEHQPSIYLFNIRIDEPVTMLTDLVVAGICFYAFFRLKRIPIQNKVHRYLRIYFVSMGIATTIGGVVGHGFLYLFNYNESLEVSPWKLPGWITSMISIAMIERASIRHAGKLISPRVINLFAWVNIIELLTFMSITLLTLNFFFVEAHSAYGLLIVVAGFNLYLYLKTRDMASSYFLIAVAVSAVSALVFMNEWGICKWYNHYDISHSVMAASAWFFYKGAMVAIFDPLSKD